MFGGDPSDEDSPQNQYAHRGAGISGTDAFWSGSITPKIARQTRIPLLLIRAVSNT
jgi:hypothetical protein